MGGKSATKTSNATLVSRDSVAKRVESFFKVSDILDSGHLAAFKGSDPFVKHSDELLCLFEFFREILGCLFQVIDTLIWVVMLSASRMERTTVASAVARAVARAVVARAVLGDMARTIAGAVARTMMAGVLVNWLGLRVVAILVR